MYDEEMHIQCLNLIPSDEITISRHKPLNKAGQGFAFASAEASVAVFGWKLRRQRRSVPGTTTVYLGVSNASAETFARLFLGL